MSMFRVIWLAAFAMALTTGCDQTSRHEVTKAAEAASKAMATAKDRVSDLAARKTEEFQKVAAEKMTAAEEAAGESLEKAEAMAQEAMQKANQMLAAGDGASKEPQEAQQKSDQGTPN